MKKKAAKKSSKLKVSTQKVRDLQPQNLDSARGGLDAISAKCLAGGGVGQTAGTLPGCASSLTHC